jgi:integrase/recombinase XerC
VVAQHIDGFLTARSYAAASAKQRRHLLTRFCNATNDDLTPPSVYAWWAGLAHLSDASRRAHLSAVRQFIAHLIMLGVLDDDPTATISAPKLHHQPPVTITPAEAARFLTVITDPRDRLAAALMLGCGLRGGDVARLSTDHVDLAQRVLRVPGKGGRVRLVPIPDIVADLLDQHLAGLDDGPLIRTPCGARLSAHQLRLRLTRALYAAGIKHGPHDGRSSHVLRRTCATTLLESGACTLVDVMAILGHQSLQSTQRYTALPDVKRLRGVIESGPLSAA